MAVKSFEFKGAYDSTWGQNGVFTWEPVSGCATCSVDRSYTCPSKEEDAKAAAAQLPQPVCWKWTLENVTDSYYNGTVCTDALANLGKYLDSIGHSGELRRLVGVLGGDVPASVSSQAGWGREVVCCCAEIKDRVLEDWGGGAGLRGAFLW